MTSRISFDPATPLAVAEPVSETGRGDAWVFGYGSLIWRPAFPFRERRLASIIGWRRRFWQASTDHRGTPDAPGRVVTLTPEPDAHCWGMAFRVSPRDQREAFETLDARESGGYERHRVELRFAPIDEAPSAQPSTESMDAWVYIAARHNPNFSGPTPLEDVARIVARAQGPSGSNLEYVLRLAQALRDLGVHDDDTFTLEGLLTRELRASADASDPDS